MSREKQTFEQARNKIRNKFKYLDLLSYNGSLVKCLFYDVEYKYFEATYDMVFRGKKNHPERSKINKKTKTQNTNFEKYGVTCIFQNQSIKNKVKQNNTKKYGVECALNSNQIKEKIKQTLLNKYGVDNLNKSEIIKNKIKQTNLQKYGCENVFQNEEIKNKIKQVNVKKYGAEHIAQTNYFKTKYKETIIKKYGVEYISQSNIIKNKIKETNLQKYGFDHPMKNSILKEKSLETFRKNHPKENFIEINNKKEYASSLEEIIFIFLKNNNINFEYGYSKNITYIVDGKKYKPDFVINNNLIIECDGLYWHSELYYDDKYHNNRKNAYEKLGFNYLFFRSDEILNDQNIVESIILNKINNEIINNFEFKEISKMDSKNFINSNSLKKSIGKYNFGSFVNNKLINILSFNIKNNEITIVNNCNIICSKVICIKLLINKLQEIFNKNINIILDARFEDYNFYKNLGFNGSDEFISYKWFDVNDKISYERKQFPGNSGYKNNLIKIFDYGNKQMKLIFT